MNAPTTPVTIDDLIARRNELEATSPGPYHNVLEKILREIAADLCLQEGKPGLDTMFDLIAHDVLEALATPLSRSSIIKPWPGFWSDIDEHEHEQMMALIHADALYGAPSRALDEAACLRLSIEESYEPPSPVWCLCVVSCSAVALFQLRGYHRRRYQRRTAWRTQSHMGIKTHHKARFANVAMNDRMDTGNLKTQTGVGGIQEEEHTIRK